MGYVEVDEAGEPIVDEEGNKTIIDSLDMGSWDHVKNQIPEDLREEKLWENVPDTQTLLKNYAHAQKRMGGSINVPGENATEDEWTEIYAKLGRPETVDDYEVGEIFGNAPGDADWDEGTQRSFLDAAHKAGLNPQQTGKLVKWWKDWQMEAGVAADRILGEAEANLRSEWGPLYDANISLAQRAAKKIGGEDYLRVMDESELGNHPEVIKAWVRVGKVLAEDNIIPAEVDGAATANQARAKISEIQSNLEHPYHKGDKEAIKEMRNLFQIAYS